MNLRGLALPAQLAALASGLTLACQVVFGDYEIDPSGILPPRECGIGETRCVGAVRERCTRSGWQPEETCASAALCNLLLDNCSACEPGTYQCNDGKVQRCSAERTWEAQPPCEAPWTCEANNTADPAQRGYSCREACSPALAYSCNNGVLQRCARDQDRWETIEVCASPALCDAQFARERERARLPVHCLSPAPCNPATGTCPPPACPSPGAFECAPTVPGDPSQPYSLRRCKADLSAWEIVDVCPQEEACDAARGRCLPRECLPVTTRCTGQQLELCQPAEGSLALTWQQSLGGPCQEGWQCDPENLQEHCVPSCAEGTVRCNERYLEDCVGGRWQRREACATRALCKTAADKKSGSCAAPQCDEHDFSCDSEQTLKKCNEERTGLNVVVTKCARGCNPLIGRCVD